MKFPPLVALGSVLFFALPSRADATGQTPIPVPIIATDDSDDVMIDIGGPQVTLAKILDMVSTQFDLPIAIADDFDADQRIHLNWKKLKNLSGEEILQKIVDVASLDLIREDDFYIVCRKRIASHLRKHTSVDLRIGIQGEKSNSNPLPGTQRGNHLIELPDISQPWSFDQAPYSRSLTQPFQ